MVILDNKSCHVITSFPFQHRFHNFIKQCLFFTFHLYREKKKQSHQEQMQSESLVLQDIKQGGGIYEENKSAHLHPLSETPAEIK